MTLKNNKGFTLVELLATVTILGILSVIAISSVSGLLEKGRTEHYKTIEKQMIQAAKSYVQLNRGALPKTTGGTSNITVDTLVASNYIQPLKDHTGEKECEPNDIYPYSYIKITKQSQTKYSYQACLCCQGKCKTNQYTAECTPFKDL